MHAHLRACLLISLTAAATHFGAAQAAVSAEEAASLKTSLTPMGAEKAANKDGTIPAWDGGVAFSNKPITGRRSDPYANEKPRLVITAKNMEQYADKLSDGVKAMLKRYPDSFRLDVYPTHRTAALPQWAYDNTFKNATRGKLIEGPGGPQPDNVQGGVPFPIPKSGAEVMWNHLLRWKGEAWHWDATQYVVTADGKAVLTNNGAADQQSPYWFKDGSPENFSGDYYNLRLVNAGPPIRAGEAIVARLNLNEDKSSTWVYLTGQRRVRKLPNSCCDTPSPTTAGLMSVDELEVFTGKLGRFDWKLLGKKELFVPYNSNRTLQPGKDADVLGKGHLNPDEVRWELHRVWVVEATLKAGERHTASRSVYYVDEDSWYALLGDRWDSKGQLWRNMWALPIVMPDLPGITAKTFGYYDLLAGTWYVNGLFNEKKEQYRLVPTFPATHFTPDALAAEGVR
ncbi:DUF1329 domain-containing protein [Uliginosibacterium sediminicola]|uniref:DUF1329 domain-containing protein n=1 Tax=Uliginosibacterium sediminicola TaxID=2024550 RepID=A0ABU9YX80_9RHOO